MEPSSIQQVGSLPAGIRCCRNERSLALGHSFLAVAELPRPRVLVIQVGNREDRCYSASSIGPVVDWFLPLI